MFTRNGEFIFTYRDGAGNEGSQTITVDWIDKVVISTIYILKGKAAVFRKRIRKISIVVYNYNVVSVKADE